MSSSSVTSSITNHSVRSAQDIQSEYNELAERMKILGVEIGGNGDDDDDDDDDSYDFDEEESVPIVKARGFKTTTPKTYRGDILLLPHQFLVSFDHKYKPGERMNFGAVKTVPGLLKKIKNELDACTQRSKFMSVKYYIQKGLKNYCLPHDVINVGNCLILYELHDFLQTSWLAVPTRKTHKVNPKTGLTVWQTANESLVYTVKEFFEALYEFDADSEIEDLEDSDA